MCQGWVGFRCGAGPLVWGPLGSAGCQAALCASCGLNMALPRALACVPAEGRPAAVCGHSTSDSGLTLQGEQREGGAQRGGGVPTEGGTQREGGNLLTGLLAALTCLPTSLTSPRTDCGLTVLPALQLWIFTGGCCRVRMRFGPARPTEMLAWGAHGVTESEYWMRCLLPASCGCHRCCCCGLQASTGRTPQQLSPCGKWTGTSSCLGLGLLFSLADSSLRAHKFSTADIHTFFAIEQFTELIANSCNC